MLAGPFHISGHLLGMHVRLPGAKVAHVFGRAAGPKLSRGDALARRQQAAGGQHGMGFDYGAVQHHRAHADKCPLPDPAAMQHGHMSDQNMVAAIQVSAMPPEVWMVVPS